MRSVIIAVSKGNAQQTPEVQTPEVRKVTSVSSISRRYSGSTLTHEAHTHSTSPSSSTMQPTMSSAPNKLVESSAAQKTMPGPKPFPFDKNALRAMALPRKGPRKPYIPGGLPPHNLPPVVPVPPLPHTPLQQVLAYFAKKTQTSVMRFCLGLEKYPDAPPLAQNTIVICFDTEGWTADSTKVTEVGFNTFDSRDMRRLPNGPGPFGENALMNTYFYHVRVQPNAHLLNIKYCPGNPEANRFGTTRFLTLTETQVCLDDAFSWPVDRKNEAAGLCPVVVLGHALGGDMDKLKAVLDWDPFAKGTVVKIVDTQQLARENGEWTRREQIGLQNLVFKMDFTYRDAHTACNDAAMTTIAAVQLVLPAHLRKPTSKRKSLQDVVNAVEAASKNNAWNMGSDKYCFRCGSRGHFENNSDGRGGRCSAPVYCQHCWRAGRRNAAYNHRTECCISYALANGNSKRSLDRKEMMQAAAQAAAAAAGAGAGPRPAGGLLAGPSAPSGAGFNPAIGPHTAPMAALPGAPVLPVNPPTRRGPAGPPPPNVFSTKDFPSLG